jgi:hypothetical protein
MKKFAFVVLTLIGIITGIQASIASEIVDPEVVEYNIYDCDFFTVEYPTTWEVDKKVTEYTFYNKVEDEYVHYIVITIYNDYPSINILNTYDAMDNGTLCNETMHFLSTLKFNV